MDELLIFSEVQVGQGTSAVENLVPIERSKLQFDDVLPAQLTGAKVLAPVMVFKEGDYVTLRQNGTKVPFKADKARMERWLQNTVRDSAVNYDHKRTDGPNNTGWLRIATGKSYLAPDPRDGKLALWAQPEFGEEALNHVESGRYRDMSIEIDPLTESIVGLALTNHPKVKNITQFSETGEQVPEGTSPQEQLAVLPPELQAMFSEMAEQVKSLTKRAEDAEAKELAQTQAAEAATREAEAKAQRAEFSEWVQNTLVKDTDGLSVIPVGSKEKVVELLVFAANKEDELVLFSDTDKEQKLSAVDLIKSLFSDLEKVQLVGRSSPGNEGPLVPEADEDSTGFGESLVSHIKKNAPKKKQ